MRGGARFHGVVRPALLLSLCLSALPAHAWDGTDSATGNNVEIERGQTVRRGRDVEYFDYGSGTYKTLDVDSVQRRGGSVEVEGTDNDGNSVTLDMDGNGE